MDTTPLYSKTGDLLHASRLQPHHHQALLHYLQGLGAESRSRFGPHGYHPEALANFYTDPRHHGYILCLPHTDIVVGYSIVRQGFLEHDAPRLQAYGLHLHPDTDGTYAPSVADAWQSRGVGQAFLGYIVQQARSLGIGRLILWGGVQLSNTKALNFYLKNQFRSLGQFEYHGSNQDMLIDL